MRDFLIATVFAFASIALFACAGSFSPLPGFEVGYDIAEDGASGSATIDPSRTACSLAKLVDWEWAVNSACGDEDEVPADSAE